MFSLEPEFTVIKCEPIIAAFGGFTYSLEDIQKPYAPPDLTSKMKRVMDSVGKSLESAYGMKAVVKAEGPTLSTTISPIGTKLKKEVRFDVRMYNKSFGKGTLTGLSEVERLCDWTVSQGMKTALVRREELENLGERGGFYIVHMLGKELDPKSTGNMIEAVERLMIFQTRNRFETKREIKDDCLKIDLNLGKHSSMEYVV